MKHPKINGGFILIPADTILCDKYKALTSPTKAVYSVILTKFIRDKQKNPDNRVKITHDQMEIDSEVGHSSVVRAVRELKNYGFLRAIDPGGLERRPTTFQLNGRYTQSGNADSSW